MYFGDFRGSKITGKVFYDAQNIPASTNNNGIYDLGERGIDRFLLFAEASGNLIASTVTDNNGDYPLWIPHNVTSPFYLVEKNKTSYISTGDYEGGVTGIPWDPIPLRYQSLVQEVFTPTIISGMSWE